MPKHIAFKCTYNNGDEGTFVGFNGTCSENIIKQNIEAGHWYCKSEKCDCNKYYKWGFKNEKPKEPCYESALFKKWQFGAGWSEKNPKPYHIHNTKIGKIAVLTTIFPNEKERERKIIGLFKIGEIKDDGNQETLVIADKDFRIRLPYDEARELNFWDYYFNPSNKELIFWGSKIFRYLDDDIVYCILKDLQKTIGDEKYKKMIYELINTDFADYGGKIIKPSGPRFKISGDRKKRIFLSRKYGSGGEGQEHRELKNWVANNPNAIGLDNVKNYEEEYTFVSGDVADLVFELADNKFAVVEIETTDPYPGCFQSLKYKVLKCAELGLEIICADVRSIVVAWSFSEEEKTFCKKYNIEFYEIKL